MKRLPPQPGEWIDRSLPLEFRFEGRVVRGFAGDTLTSALLAAGETVLGRSFKYHRPRGVLSLANHDVNALMQVAHKGQSRPNVRADVTPLQGGEEVNAVNTFGGLAADRGRFLDMLGAFLPVGFYYKAFYSKRWFPRWERMFRFMTGLGRVDLNAPRQRTPKRYGFCDVLVVGGGPAGLSAALAAAEGGARVTLVDENPHLGGSGLYALGADIAQRTQIMQMVEAVRAHAGIEVMSASFASGYYADHWVPIVTSDRIVKMRAKSVVVATGAYEQPAVFRNNDLPGVMLGSAAQRLIHRHAIQPGEHAVVLAGNDDALRVAADLASAGVAVSALVDLRADAGCAVPDGTRLCTGTAVVEALADAQGHLRGVRVAPVDANGRWNPAAVQEIACDLLVMSVGFAPALALAYQAGARMRFDAQTQQFVPAMPPPGMFVCGRANGIYTLALKLADGAEAGKAAAAFASGATSASRITMVETAQPSHPYPIIEHPQGRNFVDFDEDLQVKDFHNAAQEGYDNIELMKRFSTVGMGPSQGKHSNMNAIRILAKIRGEPVEKVGTTTSRPMFHPVPMAHLAGRAFQVARATPLEARHDAVGAVWMPAGQWRRPEYYAVPGASREDAIIAEVVAVREAAGLIDVGTLGKIEVYGPDAAQFLERVYTGRFANLKVGMTRYGLMVDESGVIIDDGVIARLGYEHFYFTTTTSGSATVYRELTRLNTLWGLNVGITNLTGHLAAMNLAGPAARRILKLITGANLSDAMFSYLGAREFRVAGVAARLLRVGFVGELGYEVHVPADQALHVWDALMAAGKAHGLRAFGVEAQRLLRLEKGHVIIGQDTDGLTNPYEAGMAWAVRADKPFFVGQRSLQILAKQPLRQKLVGIVLADDSAGVPKECHLVIENGAIAGRVTSIAHSPSCKRVIGMALVDPVLAQSGRSLRIRIEGAREIEAIVTDLPFYDKDGDRQRIADGVDVLGEAA
jgi:sarcosine oxidase subunit alpha